MSASWSWSSWLQRYVGLNTILRTSYSDISALESMASSFVVYYTNYTLLNCEVLAISTIHDYLFFSTMSYMIIQIYNNTFYYWIMIFATVERKTNSNRMSNLDSTRSHWRRSKSLERVFNSHSCPSSVQPSYRRHTIQPLNRNHYYLLQWNSCSWIRQPKRDWKTHMRIKFQK